METGMTLQSVIPLLLWAAVVVVVALTLGILFLHLRIDRHIQSLKGL